MFAREAKYQLIKRFTGIILVRTALLFMKEILQLQH